ncbi:MAG: hemolysin III family protein [Oscillospiraceae bacterium]|nr:hemolysin III family protein [Oscillospiraceae bacterium]
MSHSLRLARDPISCASHLAGAVGFSIGTVLMFLRTILRGDFSLPKLTALALFGLSLTALYSASAVYHFSTAPADDIFRLRKLDHSMIYVLIAGTYTPVLLTYASSPSNIWFTVAIWLLAFTGIFIKLCWFWTPRWLSTGFYLFMGWFILFDPMAFTRMEPGALALLISGGVCYTAGGVIYGLKKPNLSPKFGFHELFHIFVLLGSLFHFFMVYCYIA